MTSLGIDFGTGNTVLAWQHEARTEVFTLNGIAHVPSDVIISADGSVNPDPALLKSPPAGSHREQAVKRRLLAADPFSLQQQAPLLDWAAARIGYVFKAFLASTTTPVHKAVLTCPANASQAYRELLLEAGARLGLPAVEIVDEPTAAAVHHGFAHRAAHRERWLVVDWGCGTLDVSLIERQPSSADLKVVAVKGDNQLGGLDMDILLRQLLADQYGFQPESCPLWQIEALKIKLSQQTTVRDDLRLATEQVVAVEVTRSTLEKIVEPLVNRATSLIKGALAEAGWKAVDRTIATGGPMLMALTRRKIAEALGENEGDQQYFVWADPLTSVALGAAKLAEMKRVGGGLVSSQISQSIGVRIVNNANQDVYHKIISRGEYRPIRKRIDLATSVDLQDIINLEIREGDNSSAESNRLLGRLDVIVRPEARGRVKVRLHLQLSDSRAMEAMVANVEGATGMRQVIPAGIRIDTGNRSIEHATSVQSDPVDEFLEDLRNKQPDPDSARQLCEALKIKFHPDRRPLERSYWEGRLHALDDELTRYLDEVRQRIRATTLPDLDWSSAADSDQVVVDEVLAKRLTTCLANEIGGKELRPRLVALLRRFPDYRRELAAYLYAAGQNTVLQSLLARDDRPHVGLVVLLQNVTGKTLQQRHEALKAAYRLPEDTVRGFLADPALDEEVLFQRVLSEAPPPVNPVMGQSASADASQLKFEYLDGNTYITGNTFPLRDRFKVLKCRWDSTRKAWVALGRHLTVQDIHG